MAEDRFRAAVGGLKTGAGSPDGRAAEMCRTFSPTALVALAVSFSSVFAWLSFPAAWARMVAVLPPR
eukprot:4735186-Pyramimonas_sp.AAC.1